jgi:hypothetical protein
MSAMSLKERSDSIALAAARGSRRHREYLTVSPSALRRTSRTDLAQGYEIHRRERTLRSDVKRGEAHAVQRFVQAPDVPGLRQGKPGRRM